jgi:hypothetical protein
MFLKIFSSVLRDLIFLRQRSNAYSLPNANIARPLAWVCQLAFNRRDLRSRTGMEKQKKRMQR